MLISFYIYLYPITRRLTLSKLRKWKYRFPNEYKLVTRKDHIINITIILSYILVFMIGFFWLRFSNVNRVIDLKIYYDKLYYVLINTNVSYTMLNIILLLCLFILYKQLLKEILKKIKHHLIVRHLYLCNPKHTLVSDFYYNIYSKFRKHIHLINLMYIQEIVRNIFHKLGLRKYPVRSQFENEWDFNYRIQNSEYDSFLEKIISKVIVKSLLKYKYTIHYIFLGLFTIHDLIFHDFILINTFKIMPHVFLYDILVKICKFQDHNVGTTDIIIHEFLYEPWYEITEEYITFGTTTISKQEIADIIKYYIEPGLQDVYDKYGFGYHSKEKPKNHIGKVKDFYDKIQVNLDSYRNYKLLIFYIWIICLFSLNIENTIYIYMLFVLLSIINIFYINKSRNKLNEYQNTVKDETNK